MSFDYTHEFTSLLFMLVFAHMLADYPLQGPFLSEAKNRHTSIGKAFWPHALAAHSIIHAGAVFMLTGSLWLALAEALVHAVTDFLKCDNCITLNTDQFIHIASKVAWAAIAIGGAT